MVGERNHNKKRNRSGRDFLVPLSSLSSLVLFPLSPLRWWAGPAVIRDRARCSSERVRRCYGTCTRCISGLARSNAAVGSAAGCHHVAGGLARLYEGAVGCSNWDPIPTVAAGAAVVGTAVIPRHNRAPRPAQLAA